MKTKRLALSTACAGLLIAGFLALRTSGAMLSEASIVILNQTAGELELRFTDASGEATAITFETVTEDGHTFWKASEPLRPEPEIAFGDSAPVLPNIVRLRGRGIDPANVVKPLTPAIVQDTFDDFTIYQSWQGEVFVALHHEDMVTSIYYAGLWYAYSLPPDPDPPTPGWLCDGWKDACRDTTPHISSCVSAYHLCGGEMAGQVCDFMQDACELGDGPSCNMWYCCCGPDPGEELECCDNEVVDVYKVMGDLMAMKAD